MLIFFLLQVAPGCFRCRENGRKEVKVGYVIPNSGISQSLMDFCFMYEDKQAILAHCEVKKKEVAYVDSIRQTVAHCLTALAYCRWGRWRNKEPLVSLLLSPDCLYRLTFSKSADKPFGIDLKIEKTDDEIQME